MRPRGRDLDVCSRPRGCGDYSIWHSGAKGCVVTQRQIDAVVLLQRQLCTRIRSVSQADRDYAANALRLAALDGRSKPQLDPWAVAAAFAHDDRLWDALVQVRQVVCLEDALREPVRRDKGDALSKRARVGGQ